MAMYSRASMGHSELESLNLSEEQLAQIIVFLKTLDSHISAELKWLAKPDYQN